MKRIGIVFVVLACMVSAVWAEEMPQFDFDGRAWKVGYRARSDQQELVEYVLEDETVDTWSELVTVQSFPGLQDRTTLADFVQAMKGLLADTCPAMSWNVIDSAPDSILYEWKVTECSGQDDQHEIARALKGKNTIYVLHYVTKKLPLPQEVRNQWIDILRSAVLLQSVYKEAY